MPLQTDWNNEIIQITSPTTEVDMQVLHDFIEDEMASPLGSLHDDIISPEGKIEDPVNPGIFSQIIVILNSPWQIQFWGGSGYTRIYGGKLVGGLADEPIKASGTAGDITVLESPVDGLVVATDVSGLTSSESTQLDEMHAFRGLDASNPLVIKDSEESSGGVTLDVERGTPDAGDVTVTRQ